jgi:hypothetical protein
MDTVLLLTCNSMSDAEVVGASIGVGGAAGVLPSI